MSLQYTVGATYSMPGPVPEIREPMDDDFRIFGQVEMRLPNGRWPIRVEHLTGDGV